MENCNEIHTNHRSGIPAFPRDQCLTISPVAIQTARAFTAWTRCHLKAPAQAEIVLGAYAGNGTLVGVVFADACEHGDHSTAEIICLSTDGTPNACKALLSAAHRAASRQLGRTLSGIEFNGYSCELVRTRFFSTELCSQRSPGSVHLCSMHCHVDGCSPLGGGDAQGTP